MFKPKLLLEEWYDIVSILQSKAADEDDEDIDHLADVIHDQLVEYEKKGWFK